MRIAKAEATQAARDKTASKTLAEKLLKPIVNANFNLKVACTTSNTKSLDEKEKLTLNELRMSLVQMEKLVEGVMNEKRSGDSLDEGACNALCKQAQAWHARILASVASAAFSWK